MEALASSVVRDWMGCRPDLHNFRHVPVAIAFKASPLSIHLFQVCDGRVVSILEGGYNLSAISESAVAHVRALHEASASVVAKVAYESVASILAERMGTSVSLRDSTETGRDTACETKSETERTERSTVEEDQSGGRPASIQSPGEASGEVELFTTDDGSAIPSRESEALYENLLAVAAAEAAAGAAAQEALHLDEEDWLLAQPESLWIEGDEDPIEGLLDRLTIDCDRDEGGERNPPLHNADI